MTLIEQLRALGLRREAEGIYTDQNICEAAIQEIERLYIERNHWYSLTPLHIRKHFPPDIAR